MQGFVPRALEIARVMSLFHPTVGPREGSGDETTSDFVHCYLDSENAGVSEPFSSNLGLGEGKGCGS